MAFLKEAPFVRFCLAFIGGIIFQAQFSIDLVWIISILILLVILMLAHQIFQGAVYSARWKFGVCCLSIFFVLGMANSYFHSVSFLKNSLKDDDNLSIFEISDKGEESKRSFKFVGTDLNKSQSSTLLYFQKDEKVQKLEAGDIIVIDAELAEIQAPSNPREFNFKAFCENKKTYHQAYVRSDAWMIIGKRSGFLISIKKLRSALLTSIEKKLDEQNTLSVVSALVLGYKGYLQDDIRSAYSSSGTLHVLAVSGLHVGIVYLLLNYIFIFKGNAKWLVYLRLTLILIGIWLFALLSGASPSVLRSATMFSFIGIGSSINRSASIFNSIAASAFLLLMINPLMIMAVGFILSYTAVLGIIIIYPMINPLLYFKYKILEHIWAMSCVSIAAQLVVGPLSLYYFHSFPTYFLLANIIIVPMATIGLYLGIAFLVLLRIDMISNILAYFLKLFIGLMNKIVGIIESLPYSSIKPIWITGQETILMYLLIILFLILPVFSSSKIRLAIITIAIFLFTLIASRFFFLDHKEQLIVYNFSKSSVVELYSKRECFFFYTDDSDPRMQFTVSVNRDHNRARKINSYKMGLQNVCISAPLYSLDNRFINFNGIEILLVDSFFNDSYLDRNSNIIVITSLFRSKLKELLNGTNCELVILDGSIARWKRKLLTEEADEMGLELHDVTTQGAFVLDL